MIHDPQRDQRDLYMSIRNQLDELSDTHPKPRADKAIAKINQELQSLHEELLTTWTTLMVDPDDTVDGGLPPLERAGRDDSFHDLVGRWLAIEIAPEYALDRNAFSSINEETLSTSERDLRDILSRGHEVDYPNNPWGQAVGVELDSFLSQPTQELRDRLAYCAQIAETADKTIGSGLEPLTPDEDLNGQAAQRAEFAESIEHVLQKVPFETRYRWATADNDACQHALGLVASSKSVADALRNATPDPELEAILVAIPPTLANLASDLGAINSYIDYAGKWYAFLPSKHKKTALPIFQRFGLPLNANNAPRLKACLTAKRNLFTLQSVLQKLGETNLTHPDPQEALRQFDTNTAVIELLNKAIATPGLHAILAPLRAVLQGTIELEPFISSLRALPARAQGVTQLCNTLAASKLFNPQWLNEQKAALCKHEPLTALMQTLTDRFDSIETVLRIRAGISEIATDLQSPIQALLDHGANPR